MALTFLMHFSEAQSKEISTMMIYQMMIRIV
jgi:hypothetical protein